MKIKKFKPIKTQFSIDVPKPAKFKNKVISSKVIYSQSGDYVALNTAFIELRENGYIWTKQVEGRLPILLVKEDSENKIETLFENFKKYDYRHIPSMVIGVIVAKNNFKDGPVIVLFFE